MRFLLIKQQNLVCSTYEEISDDGKCAYISGAVEGTYLVAESGKGQAIPFIVYALIVKQALVNLARLV